MGITMLTLTDDILLELRQRSHTVPPDVKEGVLVWKVIYGSPAQSYVYCLAFLLVFRGN